jgi:hypothetical protein
VLPAAADESLDPDATATARKAESINFMAVVKRMVIFQQLLLIGATYQKKYGARRVSWIRCCVGGRLCVCVCVCDREIFFTQHHSSRIS